MTIGSFSECIRGCKVQVEVKETDQGWRAFEKDGEMHDCPLSDYNLKRRHMTLEEAKAELEAPYEEQEEITEQKIQESVVKPTTTPKVTQISTADVKLHYQQHKVYLIEEKTAQELQDRINATTAKNDSLKFQHYGVSYAIHPVKGTYTAMIHYVIPAEGTV